MNQSTPQDEKLETVLFYQIEQAMRQSTRFTHRVFAEEGVDLTKDQWLVLKKVHDEEGVSPLEIAKVLGKEAASMTRMLDILERKALLVRKPNPADRRSSLVFCTKAGDLTYQRVLPLVKRVRERAIIGFTSEDLQQFRTYLTTVAKNME